ncbi:MAG: ABC transporter permease, partial [Firmicutes bacterium]|nr:ABC transporter permease [Bacillota bacterium]
RLLPPGTQGHLLGTDDFGRDLWSRIIYGSRISLLVGLISVAIGLVVGSFLGIMAGYYLGWIDMLIGRVTDVLMAFPSILLALAIMAILGPSLTNVMIAVGITSIPRFTRVTRGSVLALREKAFVEAARGIGATNKRILRQHILPNILSPIIVMASTGIAGAILSEASLSFLGLGVQPPTPTWGSIINDGKQYLDIAPWIATFAGTAILLAVLGFNLLGDGLRDLLDPKLKT